MLPPTTARAGLAQDARQTPVRRSDSLIDQEHKNASQRAKGESGGQSDELRPEGGPSESGDTGHHRKQQSLGDDRVAVLTRRKGKQIGIAAH